MRISELAGVMPKATWILLAAFLGGLMLKALIGALEPKLVFFPSAGEDLTPGSLGIRYESLRIETSDGERLAAWQLEPEQPVADVVYFHGNGGNLSVWLPVLAGLHGHRLRVLAIDYRGYGLSTGTPSEAGLYRDADAVARHAATRRDTANGPLVFWGRSLGGPMAAAATRVVQPDGLVLESTFATKADVVRSSPVLRALNVFSSYRFPTRDMLDGFTRPVLVMHGTRDTVIPHGLGRELYDRLASPKRFVDIAGAGHNDLVPASSQAYWGPVLEFVGTLRHAATR
jgi:uncharacterized protein